MQYLYPVNAVHKDGKTVVLLYNESAVKSFCRSNRVGTYRKSTTRKYNYLVKSYEYVEVVNDWILRDDRGRMVDITAFEYKYSRYNKPSRKKKRQNRDLRGCTIPYTRCCKAGWKQNAPAKKNSGNGKRARDWAAAQADEKEYGIKSRRLWYANPWFH
jgi:hypothetical protein